MIIVYHQMDPTQTDVMSTVITWQLLYSHFLLIILTKVDPPYSLVSSGHLLAASAQTHVGTLRTVYKLYQVATVEPKL